ncbi:endonuclease III domain-containing protein [Rhizobium terrae]|uniref:endonuclease III domain-containing protein n=1 Tax=Rhizobium terrae TaxID=2171756 RepID=UPI001D0187D0|nr:endonuclease [Rhizobium terrae]
MRESLRAAFAGYRPHNVRKPVGQLVKSMISSRTKDGVSLRAYEKLVRRYPRWEMLAAAPFAEIERVIHEVTFAADKAGYVKESLRLVARVYPDFDLSSLKNRSVPEALSWLETLPGVARKVAASTLNFSTLAMPAFVVDAHVIRVLARFGIVGPRADTRTTYDAVMSAVPDWTAFELSEFHVMVKRLGQTFCRFETADCSRCPLRRYCRHAGLSSPPGRAIKKTDLGGSGRIDRMLAFPDRT